MPQFLFLQRDAPVYLKLLNSTRFWELISRRIGVCLLPSEIHVFYQGLLYTSLFLLRMVNMTLNWLGILKGKKNNYVDSPSVVWTEQV